MLTLDEVVVDYGRGASAIRALDIDRFEVPAATVVGVVGETGSGKTTLARAIMGLVPIRSGSIEVDGVTVSGLTRRSLRAFRASGRLRYVHQDSLGSLDPAWTVRRSILEPYAARRRSSRTDEEEQLKAVVAGLNLDEALLDRRPAELSGGQRQRVNLARALIRRPELLILDEPTSALDSRNRQFVLESLHSLRSAGVSIIVISHDIASLLGLVDRIAVLYRGRIVEQGRVDQLVQRPEHPYTRLLMASVPSLFESGLTPEERRALRAEAERVGAGTAAVDHLESRDRTKP